jgi:polygalacturonase
MRFNPQRRSLLRGTAAGALLGTTGLAMAADDPWQRAQAIIDRFATPLVFRKQDFDITAYGAAPCKLVKIAGHLSAEEKGQLDTPAPGSQDSHGAIAAAITACHAAGGGRVLIPAGSWYCAGPIVLRSNVHVHLAAGAHVYFSANPADYARHGDYDCGPNGKLVLSRWQGNDCLNFSSMVYAHGQDNIALTGEDWTSILDGQGGVPFEGGSDCWWDWKGRQRAGHPATEVAANPKNAGLELVAPKLTEAERLLIQGPGEHWRSDSRYLPALSEAGVPVEKRVFGHGHYLRPCLVEFIGCSNVYLGGYQLNAAPFWQHHPVNCRNVHISQVNMESLGPNSDGFDPEACSQVLIEDCTFNTGDDCIAIKSGKNLDTQFGPTRDVVIRNCVMNSGHGGVTLGSEMAGGIEHVYAQNIEVRNLHWASDPLGTAIRMKTNMNRGGYLRHFYVRDMRIPNGVQVKPGFYAPLPGSAFKPGTVATSGGAVITIDCDYAPGADSVRTRPPQVSDVHISNVTVGNVAIEGGKYSCYQAVVILGPVESSYNGPAGMQIAPLRNITISDCDFGNPRNAQQPVFVHAVQGLAMKGVKAGGKLL